MRANALSLHTRVALTDHGWRWVHAAASSYSSIGGGCSSLTPSRISVSRRMSAYYFPDGFLHQRRTASARQWGDFCRSPLTAHRLGKFLSSYSVTSRAEPRRDGEGSKRRNGYYLQDVEDTWARYGAGSFPSAPSGTETVASELVGENGEFLRDRDIDATKEPRARVLG